MTSLAQQDDNATSVPYVDPVTGAFKMKTRDFNIPMPRGSESLRQRLQLMSVATRMVMMKHPECIQLRTFELNVFDDYTRYLFGKKCWSMVTMKNGVPYSCPTLQHILDFDAVCRESAAEQMT